MAQPSLEFTQFI